MDTLENNTGTGGGIKESITPNGVVHFVLRDKDGNVKQEFKTKNMVVTAGRNFIASRMSGAGAAVMGWMELGTSSTAASLGQTTLVSYIVNSRTATTVSGGTPSANVVTYVCNFVGSFTGAITEAGIFNIATQNTATMLCRTTFGTITKAATDTLTITWTITIT